jgi:hypothetical protein
VADLAVADAGGAGIAIGATLFLADGEPPVISNTSTGRFYGFALEAIAAGQTATIRVLHVPSPGAGTLGAGTVGTTNLANLAVTAAKLAADAVTTAKILDANVTESKLAENSLSGTVVGNAADDDTDGAIPILYIFTVPDAATGDVDRTIDDAIRVVDCWAVKTGGAGGAANTVQLFNGANAISDAMSININDKAVARAASIDDAYHEVAASGTLKVTRTKAGGNAACIVYVSAVRIASGS